MVPQSQQTRPIRVLHVLSSFQTGGTEQGVVNLINFSDSKRVEFGVCVLDPTGAEENLSKIRRDEFFFRVAKKRFGNDPMTGWRLVEAADEGQFQIIHSHGWPTYLESWIALKCRPKLIGVHGEHGTSFLERYRRRKAFGLLSRRWNRFLFVSETLKREFRAHTNISVDSMRVIRNGVDFARFSTHNRDEADSEKVFTEGWYHVGTAGRLHDVKNHWMLMRAAEKAKDAGAKWQFHLAGDGPLRREYQAFINRRHLGDWVRLHGRVAQMERFYQGLDLFVLTSRSEGHSNALLEAIASKLPVITTPVGDVRKFLRDGENGWIVDQDDSLALFNKIAFCADNAKACEAVAERGWRDASRLYSIENMIESYTETYESLLQRRGEESDGRQMDLGRR